MVVPMVGENKINAIGLGSLVILIASIKRVSLDFFGRKILLSGGIHCWNQGIGITCRGRLYINMSDQIQGSGFLIFIICFCKCFHYLNLVTLPLMAAVGRIRVRRIFEVSLKESLLEL